MILFHKCQTLTKYFSNYGKKKDAIEMHCLNVN